MAMSWEIDRALETGSRPVSRMGLDRHGMWTKAQTEADSIPGQRHRARKVLAGHARDAAELAQMLDIVGLLHDDTDETPPEPARKTAVAEVAAAAKKPPRFKDAACDGMDTEVFYREGLRGEELRMVTEVAVKVCNSCPVRVRCLNWALDRREDYGVWGGLDEDARQKLRRSRYRKAARRAVA